MVLLDISATGEENLIERHRQLDERPGVPPQAAALLETAIENLVGKKQEIGVASLFSKGGTSLQKALNDGMDDFELITFLVLK
jgi:hypothetical protein